MGEVFPTSSPRSPVCARGWVSGCEQAGVLGNPLPFGVYWVGLSTRVKLGLGPHCAEQPRSRGGSTDASTCSCQQLEHPPMLQDSGSVSGGPSRSACSIPGLTPGTLNAPVPRGQGDSRMCLPAGTWPCGAEPPKLACLPGAWLMTGALRNAVWVGETPSHCWALLILPPPQLPAALSLGLSSAPRDHNHGSDRENTKSQHCQQQQQQQRRRDCPALPQLSHPVPSPSSDPPPQPQRGPAVNRHPVNIDSVC